MPEWLQKKYSQSENQLKVEYIISLVVTAKEEY